MSVPHCKTPRYVSKAMRLNVRNRLHASHPIYDPLAFHELLLVAIGDKSNAILEDRACVITRSPAEYGRQGSVVIEWEGSPPRFSIYAGSGVLVVKGIVVKWPRKQLANSIIDRFLMAHPAMENGSPVWVGARWTDRP